jgi:hypothetical protein
MKTSLISTTPDISTPMNTQPSSNPSPWIARSLKTAVVIIAVFIAIRVAAALWLKSYLGDSVDDLAKVTGMDAAIAAWLKGIAMTVAALSLAPLLLRWICGLTLPGFDSAKTLRLSGIALAISGLAVCSPPAIRAIRGVDKEGLPAMLQPVDPLTARWFTPDNRPQIAVSFERDGHWQFWNRPGTTPQSAVQAVPVSAEIRAAWETMRDIERSTKAREQRDAEEKARKEAQLREQTRLKEESNRAEERSRELARREEAARKERIEVEARTRQLAEVTKAEQAKQEQLRASNDAETRRQRAEQQTSGKISQRPAPASVPRELPWKSHTVLPGRFGNFTNFPAGVVEVNLPVDAVIEVQGYPPLWYRAGVSRIPLQQSRNFRVSSRADRPFQIQVRPAVN